ncbi:hypothetical protein [Chryseobacterium sp. FH1]|uniref:hypothetical protein n=1 Tax=Chryseobacterium sp. FH1 TaxID=1233951 RepID=UPI0004E2F2C5|nr:hypothetical protein [Chryseobacterium sp. FH1]KFC20563.1 hypothetical protein IO90_15600 [Chryseobacterium sp. FH1]
MDDFVRSIFPFSIYSEINNLAFKGKSVLGCLGAILIFPLTIILTLAPFILEFILLKDLIKNWQESNFLAKASITLTIWLILISFYFPLHKFIIVFKENLK